MKKKILCFIIITFLFVFIHLQSNEDKCNPPTPSSPGGDQPDENYSYSNGNYNTPDITNVLIFENGFFKEADPLINGTFFNMPETAENLLKKSPLLVIPTGGLYGRENDSLFKIVLGDYAQMGGTLLIFAQQYDSHIDNVVPVSEEESLKTYGWRQDSSCLRNSVYFNSIHPALSSSTNELIDAGVDGYFSVYPSNSTILLRRKTNLEPALLYYPYGNGTVILTSMFTDWAYAHSQATTAELRIIRDLITFAKNPKLPIPMVNLEEIPTPAINLNVQVENNTELTAAKAKLMVYTPDRTTLLYELEVPVSLNPGEITQAAVNFTLPELQTKDYGICHVDHGLYNAENEIIQLPNESDSGRFSIYKIITPVTIKDGVYQWVTVKDENVYWGQDAEFTTHFKNTRSESRTLDINNPFFSIGHGGSEGPTFPSFQVILPPGEEYQHHVSLPTTQFNPDVKCSVTIRIQYYDANGVLKQTGPAKTFFLLGTMTNSTLKLNTLNTPTPVVPGGTLNYSITSRYIIDPLPGNTNIKVTLEKYNKPNSQYNEIQTLFQVDHDFTVSSAFQYNGSYTPNSVYTNGEYRIKLEVTAPNGLKEPLRYQYFYYDRSGFNVTLGNIQDEKGNTATRFIPGQTYTIPINIKNLPRNNYNVKNGTLVLSISGNNEEIYRKEINGININSGEEKELLETFVFTPTQMGINSLYYRYWDETIECPSLFTTVQRFNCNTNISVIADKNIYTYLDTANIKVIVTGAGTYGIHITCTEAGIDETRNVQIPEGNFKITEMFPIPIGVSSIYNLNIEVKNALSISQTRIVRLAVSPLQFDYNGNFSETFARAGSDLHLNLNIKNLSGMTNPVSGQLSVVSSQLNYQDVQTVTIQPLLDNPFTYTIPINTDAAEGIYRFDVQFKINDTIYISKQHSISLPGPEIKFISPGTVFNAGDAITFNFENTGGKNGTFEFEILLIDSLKKSTAEHHETLTIAAGANNTLSLNLPGNLKTGIYQLVIKSVETISNKTVERIFPISITGLSAALNSYPLKENYFNDEVVSGKAEITPGTGNIENGVLNARIVKPAKPKTIEAIFDSMNCMTRDSNNCLCVGWESGVSVYYTDDGSWQHYTQLSTGEAINNVTAVATGLNAKIVALAEPGIIAIDESQNAIALVPNPWTPSRSPRKLAVDTQSRIWVYVPAEVPVFSYQMGDVYYHDLNAGDNTWNIAAHGDVNQIISDGSGGVWLTGYNRLIHIKADLSLEDFSPNNSDMPAGDVQALYVDKQASGNIWMVIDATLYRFNGVSWTAYSSYNGYPTNGVASVTGDDAENIYAVGINNDNTHSLYQVNNTELVKNATVFSPLSSYDETYYQEIIGGYLYTYGSSGSEGGEWIGGLLKINMAGASGNGSSSEQEFWNGDYPVNVTSGSPLTLDLTTGKTLDPGVYLLKTQMLSSLEQVLAESNKIFSVQDHNVPVSLSINGPTSANTSFNGIVKPGQELPLPVTIANNTTETHTGITVIIKKTSPSGTVEEVLSENINLEPGQTITRDITFNETTPGTWQLTPQTTEAETTLAGSPMLISVIVPTVTMEIMAPTPNYAGNEPFDIQIKLKNEGNIEAGIRGQVSGVGGQVKLDESLTLEPGEEKVLSFSDTLTADTNYTITLSGDVEKTETITVKYGYVENLSLNVLPTYREGTVTIDYTLANTGGLPFTDTLHFELFASGDEGATVPLYTFDRNYNLYPGESPITDTLNFPLSPGIYQLTWQSIKEEPPAVRGFFEKPPLNPEKLLLGESLFTVLSSGLGNVVLTANTYPIGMNEIQYSVTNTDTTPGKILITITILTEDPTTPILSETRTYYLQPNETQQDFISYEFSQKSNYTLTISSPKITTPINTIIQILNPDEVTATLTIGTPETNHIPVTVDISNTGYNPFNGVLVMETSGIRSEEPITINSNSSLNQTFTIETASLTPSPGTKDIKVYLYDASGNTISQTTASTVITGPDIKVTETPQNLEITAGEYVDVTLKLKNQGHLRGEARLKLSAFDTLYQEREITLEPGEEIEIDGISIDAPGDCPTGNYPFNYTLTLTGPGVQNSLDAGNFTFKVNGISLNVEATLDRSLYNIGETAQLTLSIASPTPSDAPLEAMVNWGNFSEKRTFIMSSASTSLLFEIPLDEKREEKVFYGIYHEGGKGIHLNDIYLHFKDKISVETDKQVYAPGEVIHAVFTLADGEQSGIITVDAFGESQTLTISSTAFAAFQVSPDTFGGTYGIRWRFVSSVSSQEELSGSHPFDVSGLVVKVAKSELEKGKYSTGETIKAAYTFEANRDDSLALRCWVTTPSNQWTFLGESSVTVSADKQSNAVSSYSFTTTEAGAHELVYGLYKEDNLVVSGRLAFDVGDAVLIGIVTDKYEYKDGSENVNVGIDYLGLPKVFGGPGTVFQKGPWPPEAEETQETLLKKGFSTSQSFSLELYLDNEKVEERSLTIDGVGHTEITLNSSRISGGSHLLKAILTKDELTSSKTAGFLYGTNLPDLTLTLGDTSSEGLNYTYQIAVTNRGKTSSAATTLVFTDNGTSVETVSIPALAAGTSQENIFNWSGSGKAGSHEFLFEIDPTNTVKEYSEDNNKLTLSEEVPLVFYNLEVEPIIWPANSDINIITRLINNQNSIAPLTLNLSITHDSTGTSIFQRTLIEELPAFGTKALNDHFNTGVTPAGQYTLGQDVTHVTGDSVTLHKEINVIIEATKTISATLQLLPVKIPSGADTEVELTMTLKNTGNVALEDETVVIDVFNKTSEEIVKTEQFLISIPLGQEIPMKKTMALNLVEGQYEIRLKYLDNVIVTAELTAAAAIKPEKTIAVRPRVLIMNLKIPGIESTGNASHSNHHDRLDSVVFLTNLLQAAEIQHEAVQGILESYFQFHKGHDNVNIILGQTLSLGRKLCDELKERVWRGEGLIFIVNNPINAPDMVDWLGVKVNLDTKTKVFGGARDLALREGFYKKDSDLPEAKVILDLIQVLPGDLTGDGGQMELMKKNRLTLEKKSSDVVIVAQTQKKKQPVITYRKYGSGHILVIAMPVAPLAYKSGSESIAQLLVSAVNLFSSDIYTISILTRVLPVEISLSNEGTEEKTLTVKEILPYGVEGYDYSPAFEDTGDENEIKWNIKVPGGVAESISYWLKCPDQIGTYEVKTEIYDGDTKLEEISLDVDVSQAVLSRIMDLLAELEALEVSGHDANAIHRAKNCLENIRSRSVGSLADHLQNLHDAVQAVESIGRVTGLDVSALRLKAGDIMVIMGRRLYEEVKQWGSSRLIPFTGLITAD